MSAVNLDPFAFARQGEFEQTASCVRTPRRWRPSTGCHCRKATQG
jgi:hypothetical protein